MSILIKGAEIPTEGELIMRITPDGKVAPEDKLFGYRNTFIAVNIPDPPKRDLLELDKLEDWLKLHRIPHTREDSDDRFGDPKYAMDFHQIKAITPNGYNWDVVCHYGSYGAEQGLLEGMGAPFEKDVEGWLTAQDVIDRIRPFYSEECK